MTRGALQNALGLTDRKSFRERYLKPALTDGHGKTVRFLPNARATYGIFLIKQQETSACPPTASRDQARVRRQ